MIGAVGRKKMLAFIIVPSVTVVVLAGAVAVSRLDSASGDVTTLSGSAYGESVNIHSVLGITVTSGPTPSVSLPPRGGGPFQDHLASANVPGLLSAGLSEVSTQGTPGPHQSATSSADVAGLSLAGGAIQLTWSRAPVLLRPPGSPGRRPSATSPLPV